MAQDQSFLIVWRGLVAVTVAFLLALVLALLVIVSVTVLFVMTRRIFAIAWAMSVMPGGTVMVVASSEHERRRDQ